MTLKEKINYMLSQYSMTKDNPTVLRELRRLAALTAQVVEWVEDNDPTDFSKQLADVNARLDEIDALVKSLNLDTINADIAALKVSVAKAQSDAAAAKTAAEAAETASEKAVNDVSELTTSVNEFKETVNSSINTLTDSVNEIDTKVDAVDTKVDGAVTASNDAKTIAGAASTRADTANTTANAAKTAADNAKTVAEKASTDVQEMQLALEGKQDELTFDAAPTAGSQNPVTSDGIYKAIQAGGSTVVLDDTVTQNSQNGVKSSGIYTAIERAKETLSQEISNVDTMVSAHTDDIAALQEFQQTQETTNETHNTQIAANQSEISRLNEEKQNRFYQTGGAEPEYPIETLARIIPERVGPEDAVSIPTTEAVSEALRERQKELTYFYDIADQDVPASNKLIDVMSANGDGSLSWEPQIAHALSVKRELEKKQDELTFDAAPTEGSRNPVTSDGIYKAIQEGGSTVVLDDTVTQNSQNGVKSSGIYTAIKAVQDDIDGQKSIIASNTDAIDAAEEKITSLEEYKQTVDGELDTLSGEVAALDADKMNKIDVDKTPTANSTNLVESGGVYTYGENIRDVANGALNTAMSKQDVLTFDTTPRNGSGNPVTSGGLYNKFKTVDEALADKQGKLTTVDVGGSIVRNVSTYVLSELTSEPAQSSYQMATAYAVWNAIQAAAGSGGGTPSVIQTSWTAVGTDHYEPTADIPSGFTPLFMVLCGRVDIYNVAFMIPIVRTASPTSYVDMGSYICNHPSTSVDLLMPTNETMKVGYNETYTTKLAIKYASLTYARFLSGNLVSGTNAQISFNRNSYIFGIQS